MSVVYWIRHKDHTDMFSHGYVGVSRRLTRRFWEHQNKSQNSHLKNAIEKYGWDNLVKTEIVISDEQYCLEIEQKLRPNDNIGWNIIAGGGMPPKTIRRGFKQPAHVTEAVRKYWTGRKQTQEHRNKISAGLMGRFVSEETRKKISESNKGKHQPMTGKKFSTVECPHCKVVGGINCMQRWHMDNCKHKENL